MTFERQDTVVQEPEIERIEVYLMRTTRPYNNGPAQKVTFQLHITDQNGVSMRELNGNLIPHLTSAQIATLISFMDEMWVKAEAEVLPDAT